MDSAQLKSVKSSKNAPFSVLLYKNFDRFYFSPKTKSPNLNQIVSSINGFALNIEYQ